MSAILREDVELTERVGRLDGREIASIRRKLESCPSVTHAPTAGLHEGE